MKPDLLAILTAILLTRPGRYSIKEAMKEAEEVYAEAIRRTGWKPISKNDLIKLDQMISQKRKRKSDMPDF